MSYVNFSIVVRDILIQPRAERSAALGRRGQPATKPCKGETTLAVRCALADKPPVAPRREHVRCVALSGLDSCDLVYPGRRDAAGAALLCPGLVC